MNAKIRTFLNEAHRRAAEIDARDNPKGMPKPGNLNLVFEQFADVLLEEVFSALEESRFHSGDEWDRAVDAVEVIVRNRFEDAK